MSAFSLVDARLCWRLSLRYAQVSKIVLGGIGKGSTRMEGISQDCPECCDRHGLGGNVNRFRDEVMPKNLRLHTNGAFVPVGTSESGVCSLQASTYTIASEAVWIFRYFPYSNNSTKNTRGRHNTCVLWLSTESQEEGTALLT